MVSVTPMDTRVCPEVAVEYAATIRNPIRPVAIVFAKYRFIRSSTLNGFTWECGMILLLSSRMLNVKMSHYPTGNHRRGDDKDLFRATLTKGRTRWLQNIRLAVSSFLKSFSTDPSTWSISASLSHEQKRSATIACGCKNASSAILSCLSP